MASCMLPRGRGRGVASCMLPRGRGRGGGELMLRGPHLAVRMHEGDATGAEQHVHLAGGGGEGGGEEDTWDGVG